MDKYPELTFEFNKSTYRQIIPMNSNQNEFVSDSYLNAAFPFADRVRRLCWNITWAIFCRWSPSPFHLWRIFFLRLFGAQIGDNNFIYPSCIIWAPWLLKTQNVVTIGPVVEIYNPGGLIIGHHAIISQGAYICGATHDYNSKNFTYIKKEILIEANAWICARAIVLPGVICGEGSVLGAGSVTSKNLAPWTVYTGSPATKIKMRNQI